MIGTAEGSKIWGNPEKRSVGGPEERRFGATRSFTDGKTGRCEIQGNLGNHQPGPEDAGIGATRDLIGGDSGGAKSRGNSGLHHCYRRRMRDSRQLGDPSPAKPEDAVFGATRRLILGDTAERRTGATRSFINGTAEKREIRGNSEIRSRHSRMDRRFGATRRFVASAAEGCGVRGNPETRRWPSGKMQGAGQLGSSSTS